VRELALFSGAGGGLLGSLLLGWHTVAYVERDAYCQQVLRARIADGYLHDGPIYDDVRTFPAEEWRGRVEVVSAGFPCQPFSVAGRQLGEGDPRNMWPATERVLRLVRPRFALLENVPGLIARAYFGTVLGDLAALGFDAEWGVLGADDVGAPHRRKRLWIVAYRHGDGAGVRRGAAGDSVIVADAEDLGRQWTRRARDRRTGLADRCTWWLVDPADVGHAELDGLEGSGDDTQGRPTGSVAAPGVDDPMRRRHRPPDEALRTGRDCDECAGRRQPEPHVGRVAHGVAARVDQLRALGNGQVPLVAAEAWRLLCERAGLEV